QEKKIPNTTTTVAGEATAYRLIDDRGGGIGIHKKIMQEWRILKKSLPNMIYVRVYENRINLLTIEKNRLGLLEPTQHVIKEEDREVEPSRV
ncbi:hypothetical protein TorRG33x02_347820, partial [Trema orientale]